MGGRVALKVTVVAVSLLAVLVGMRMSDDARAARARARKTLGAREPALLAREPPALLAREPPTRGPTLLAREPPKAVVACLSSSWRWESLQRVAEAFAAVHPDVEVLVERTRDPAGRMAELLRTRGVRCFLSATSEGHVRKVLPFLREHPEVVCCSPTSTALPDSFEGGLLPPNLVRVIPHDGNMPNVIGKCAVNEVGARIRKSRPARPPPTVPEAAPENRHLFDKPQVERIAAAGLLVDAAEQQPEQAAPPDPLAGLHTVAVAYVDTAYGQGLVQVLRRQLPAMNLGLAFRYVPFPPGTEHRETAALLDAMAEPERLDVVVYLGFGGDFNAYARACRSFPRVQALHHVLGPGVAFDADLLRNPDAGPLMRNAYALVYFGEAGSGRRYAELAGRMGGGVGPASALQHDALSLLAAAERAGGGHEELRRAAATFSGVTGQIRLDSRGDRVGGAYNLVGVKRALGALSWKVVGTRSVLGTVEVQLKRGNGAVHTLIGSKLDFTRKSLPVERVLRAAGTVVCPEGAQDDGCTCAPADGVEVRSTDLYGNERTWQGDLRNLRALSVHAADHTTVRVACSVEPAFSVRVMPVKDDADPSPIFNVPDHAQSSAEVEEVVVI